jgi:hypothetical protein
MESQQEQQQQSSSKKAGRAVDRQRNEQRGGRLQHTMPGAQRPPWSARRRKCENAFFFSHSLPAGTYAMIWGSKTSALQQGSSSSSCSRPGHSRQASAAPIAAPLPTVWGPHAGAPPR